MRVYSWAPTLPPVGVERFLEMVREMAGFRYDPGEWSLDKDMAKDGIILLDGVSHVLSQLAYEVLALPTEKWRYPIYEWLCHVDVASSFEDVSDILSDWEQAKDHIVLHMNSELRLNSHIAYKQEWVDDWHMGVCVDLSDGTHYCPPANLFQLDKSIDEVLRQAYENTKKNAEVEFQSTGDAYILYNESKHVTGLLHDISELGVPYSDMGLLLAAPDPYRIIALPVNEGSETFGESFDRFAGATAYFYRTSPWRSSSAAVWWRPKQPLKTVFTECRMMPMAGAFYKPAEGFEELVELGLVSRNPIQ